MLFLAICQTAQGQNLCAITFDDGPGPHTARLLDALREYGIPATFFILGENAVKRPGVVRRMIREGHETGSHTWSHHSLKRLPFSERRAEMLKPAILIELLGGECRYLRPPYGEIDREGKMLAARYGLTSVLWDVDSLDWKMKGRDYSMLPDGNDRPFAPGKMRGIFLFHDIHRHTVDDIGLIIDGLEKGGCDRFVTVSEYLDSVNRRYLTQNSRPKD